MENKLVGEDLANTIFNESEKLVIFHLGGHPGQWYYGGPNHNDDRLLATFDPHYGVVVSDGEETDFVDSMTFEEVQEYVKEWHTLSWTARGA